MRCPTLAFLLLVACSVILCVGGQLNFSPGWGKRSSEVLGRLIDIRSMAGLVPEDKDPCNTLSVTAVLNIYSIIKNEARRMAQCNEEYLTK
ncbi:UNVERIFIED_CONTAM: hypothetical protein RMT77_005588 [Armadillidium vulgare]